MQTFMTEICFGQKRKQQQQNKKANIKINARVGN